jgi:hypothetical protein
LYDFIVVLVDDSDTACEINDMFRNSTTPNFRLVAYEKMRILLGLRPTLVIDTLGDRAGLSFDRWYNECVRPCAIRAKTVTVESDHILALLSTVPNANTN